MKTCGDFGHGSLPIRGKSTAGSLNRLRPVNAASGNKLCAFRRPIPNEIDCHLENLIVRNRTVAALLGLIRRFHSKIVRLGEPKTNYLIGAPSGEDAIALSKSDRSIDIVFTDISLIGATTGWDVAECFRADRPNVSVLYTSEKPIDHGRCTPGSAFLAKPYRHYDVVSACQRLHTK
jgi:CheY-like chemotaxis protein